jgi:Cu/Ag efflux protein CusF
MKTHALILAFLLAAGGSALAADKHDHHGSASMSDAEVRKVDRDAKKITLKHGEI